MPEGQVLGLSRQSGNVSTGISDSFWGLPPAPDPIGNSPGHTPQQPSGGGVASRRGYSSGGGQDGSVMNGYRINAGRDQMQIVIRPPPHTTRGEPSMKILKTCGVRELGLWRSQLPRFDALVRRYRRQVDPHYVPLLSDWVEDHVWMQISRSGLYPDERTVGPEPNDAAVEDYLRQ